MKNQISKEEEPCTVETNIHIAHPCALKFVAYTTEKYFVKK